MQKILAFFLLMLNTSQCFSNLEGYINQEFERNRSLYGCIKHLDFGFTRIDTFVPLGEAGLKLILEKDELFNLESINLENNCISEADVQYFIEKLVLVAPNLKKINLSYNPIGFLGAIVIGNVARQWPMLETLLLREAAIHSEGLIYLFSKLSIQPKLKNLDVSSNARLKTDSAYHLGCWFAAFSNLENVSLENLGLNDDVMSDFLHGMDMSSRIEGCIAPLKTVNFGSEFGSFNKIKSFIKKLNCSNELVFYYRSNMFNVRKENDAIKIYKYNTNQQSKL